VVHHAEPCARADQTRRPSVHPRAVVEVLHRTVGAGAQFRTGTRDPRSRFLDARILGPLHARREPLPTDNRLHPRESGAGWPLRNASSVVVVKCTPAPGSAGLQPGRFSFPGNAGLQPGFRPSKCESRTGVLSRGRAGLEPGAPRSGAPGKLSGAASARRSPP
jgi:hypothetical protein